MDHNPRSDLKGLLRSGLSKSLVSLGIKVATAGLTYLSYVVLSRLMGATDYGYFAFGLSLATILAIGANFGQQTAILRYWPAEMVAGHPERALNALRAGGAITLVAGGAVSVGLLLASFATDVAGHGPVLHLYAAAALILPLAFAEYWSSVLRAQGSVWTGLAPRDLIWRGALPLAVVLLWYAGVALSGWAALLLTAALLAMALGLQYLFARARRYEIAAGAAGLGGYWREHGTASRSFFLGTVLDSAALNIDIIFVGLLVAPAAAGVYFNAFRTAGLLTLFMFAITLVAAPMVAHHYHAGEMRKAQAITALCAWAGFLFSLVVFAGFLLFGEQVMGLFGGDQQQGGAAARHPLGRPPRRCRHRPVAHRDDDDRARAGLCTHLRRGDRLGHAGAGASDPCLGRARRRHRQHPGAHRGATGHCLVQPPPHRPRHHAARRLPGEPLGRPGGLTGPAGPAYDRYPGPKGPFSVQIAGLFAKWAARCTTKSGMTTWSRTTRTARRSFTSIATSSTK
jgi:O-antigen/teichoic acid export membrane protein